MYNNTKKLPDDATSMIDVRQARRGWYGIVK